MSKKVTLVLAFAMFVVGSGCGQGPSPPPKDGQGKPDEPSDGAAVANLPPTDDGGRIRVTLSAGGEVVRIEGRQTPPSDAPTGSPVGDWQTFLEEQETQSKSADRLLATIEVYGLTEEEVNQVNNPEVEDPHPHAGVVNPASPPHCHDWIYVGSKRYLVHC